MKKASKTDVKAAARGQWRDLLASLGGIDAQHLDGKHHPCPRCGGKDRFRLIDTEAGAVLCNQCFSTKNGDGFAALGWLCGWDFNRALEEVARHLGLDYTPTRKKREEFDWRPWNDALVAGWVRHKPGITVEAVQANGGRLAKWHGEFLVVAVPILSLLGRNRGWIFWNSTGRPLPSKSGDVKMRCSAGAKPGWVGAWALDEERREKAEVIYRVEGPTDMLALWAAIPADKRDTHLVVSPPFGAKRLSKREHGLLELFRGKKTVVVADNDTHGVGQKEGMAWAEDIAAVASECRYFLPPDTGQDLRDWLAAGGTAQALLDATQGVSRPVVDAAPDGGADTTADEADDDPARLAKLFIRQQTGDLAMRLAHYCGRWYYWEAARWREAEDDEVKGDLVLCLEDEFTRIWFEEQALAAAKKTDEEPKPKRKVHNTLLGSVLTHLRAYCRVAREVEFDSELVKPDEFAPVTAGAPRRWITMANGILRMPNNGDEPELVEHTPLWWSLSALPYQYEPAAGQEQRPWFEHYLETSLQRSQDIMMPLQEWGGYCLTRDLGQQRFLLLTGQGANGKSTWCGILEALVGPDNTSNVSLDQVSNRFALYQTLGAKVNLTTETARYLDDVGENRLKQLASGDPMQFEAKGKDPIRARPTAKWVISCNDPPRFADRSDATWRRLLLVPFDYTVPPGQQVKGLDSPSWWLDHGEMPAIFNWFLEGYRRLMVQETFTRSLRSESAVEELRDDCDHARFFCKRFYMIAENGRVKCDDVYQDYRKYCEHCGYKPIGSREFGKVMRRVYDHLQRTRLRGEDSIRDYWYEGVVCSSEERPWGVNYHAWR